MADQNLNDTDDVSNKMEGLMIAHQSGQEKINTVLEELDRKIRKGEARLAEDERKRAHAKEVERKLDEKVKIAKMKVEESYQRMLRGEHVANEWKGRNDELKNAINDLRSSKTTYTDEFIHEIKNIVDALKDMRIDPRNYDPEADLDRVNQEIAQLEDEGRKLDQECAELKARIDELSKRRFPAEEVGMTEEEACRLIRDLELENRLALNERRQAEEELAQLEQSNQ